MIENGKVAMENRAPEQRLLPAFQGHRRLENHVGGDERENVNINSWKAPEETRGGFAGCVGG